MNYAVKNEQGSQVGRSFETLDKAVAFIELNEGYSKGWYVEALSESADTAPRPQFLTEA